MDILPAPVVTLEVGSGDIGAGRTLGLISIEARRASSQVLKATIGNFEGGPLSKPKPVTRSSTLLKHFGALRPEEVDF